MLKRWVLCLTAALMAVSLCCCCAAESLGALTDGVYAGTGAGKMAEIACEVTVEGGKITAVTVTEHSETPGLCDAALESVPAQIVEKQSLDVDLVSGATGTSQGILDAAKAALAQAGAPVHTVTALAAGRPSLGQPTEGEESYAGENMPLRYALDREAMIVYQFNGDELAMNQRTQLWVPGAVAKYFARDVVDIEVTCQAETPEIIEADAEQAAKVSIMNDAKDAVFNLGESIQFEGYADDCRSAVAAVEFSMDGGETWIVCETLNATTDRWVYWYFTIAPEAAGEYELTVRARTEDGTVSPIASSMRFAVTEG